MTDNVANLTLDLRTIRADMAHMADAMRALSPEMPMRQHLGGVVTIQEHDHADLASPKVRLDRIERRLELVD